MTYDNRTFDLEWLPTCQLFGSNGRDVPESQDDCPSLFRGRVTRDLRRLAVPQRDNRIDACRATRRNVAGQKRCAQQHKRRAAKHYRIRGAHII